MSSVRSSPQQVAVFASGGGSNLQAMLDRFGAAGAENPPVRVELVVGSRPGIGALERAARAGVPAEVPPDPENGAALLELLERHAIDLVVLAGYLRLVPAPVVEHYRGRMLNIHPALLPAFGGRGMYGMRVHRAVIDSGARVSGATVHLVDEEYDRGRILAQWPVPVLPTDTPERLGARVLGVEHRLLPAVVAAVVRGGAPPDIPTKIGFSLVPDGTLVADEVERFATLTASDASSAA